MWRGTARFPTALNTNPSAFPLPDQSTKRDASCPWEAPSFHRDRALQMAQGHVSEWICGVPPSWQATALRPPHPGRGVSYSIPALRKPRFPHYSKYVPYSDLCPPSQEGTLAPGGMPGTAAGASEPRAQSRRSFPQGHLRLSPTLGLSFPSYTEVTPNSQ